MIKKEALHQVKSARWVTVTAIMMVLSLLAAVVGTEDYRRRSRNHQHHLEQSRQELGRLHVYSFLQPVVVREPEPLSVLDRGLESRLGEEIRIEITTVPAAGTGGHPGNEFMAGLPDVDLTMLVQMVLGLLALLLTFDAIVGERQSGTLKLVLANDVSRASLAAGKLIGACLALILPLLAGFAVTLGVLILRAGVTLDAGRWQRLGGLFAAYLLYLSLMALLGLMISLWTRDASSSLVASLLVWLTAVFLIPQVSAALSGDVGEADRARRELGAEMHRLSTSREAARRQIEAPDPRDPRRRRMDPDYPLVVKHKNWARRYRYGTATFYEELALYKSQEFPVLRDHADRVFEARQAFRPSRHRAERAARWIRRLSPSHLVERVAASMAGTSGGDVERYLEACRAYRLEVLEYLEGRGAFDSWRWFTDDPPENTNPWMEVLGLRPQDVDEAHLEAKRKEFFSSRHQDVVTEQQQQFDRDPERLLDFSDLPPFASPAPGGLAAAARQVRSELAWLALANLVLGGLLVRGFQSYPPWRRQPASAAARASASAG